MKLSIIKFINNKSLENLFIQLWKKLKEIPSYWLDLILIFTALLVIDNYIVLICIIIVIIFRNAIEILSVISKNIKR
jgi:hypothetical protein